jgi:hypothetical protein
MEFNGVLILAAVWFVVSLISRAGRRAQTPRPRSPMPVPRPTATQQEGTRLELMLRELQRTMEDAGRQQRARELERFDPPHPLEAEPEARSLEEMVSRPARREVDQDDEAEQLVARRIKAAEARDVAQPATGRVALHDRLKQEPADHTAVRGYSAQQLRDAMVWREILGPPVGLRCER